jgi:signal recognition particle receptor subunit beta
MYINWKLREINLKIVYYGPSFSGKTTNLQYIHSKTHPDRRGDLVSLKTREDRTLYFDYMQIELGKIAGLKPRFDIFTVPGQVYYKQTRKLVLKGADGVVFVADSQRNRLLENIQAVRDMRRDLRDLGSNPEETPLVLQVNKRDLEDIVPVNAIKGHLGMNGVPTIETVTIRGDGVLDGLKMIINRVVNKTQHRF